MIEATDLLVGGLVVALLYALVRIALVQRRPAPFQDELRDILTKEEHKVRGRVATRTLDRTE
ncbi:MAG TPA: hypothetical protein VJH22_06785 [Candidatus Nanoarchaeia archaeon]|nr:hypothetical protein [Candidatus Nanoarchaeia archaeon]